MTRSGKAFSGLALALALIGGACSGGGEGGGGAEGGDGAAAGKSGGEFSLQIGEPEHLIPGNSTESEGNQVLSALFTRLVDYDPQTSQPVNAMAESIESTDQKVWTVKIKPGWTFHNGEPVTAQSFVDGWNFTAYSPNANQASSFFENVEGYDDLQGDAEATPPVEPKAKEMSGLKALDEATLEVTLKEAFSQYPLTVGYTAFSPMPKAAFNDLKAFEEAPIGNGPYMMDGKWEHDVRIKVKRFPDYQGTPGKADAIEFRIYSEILAAFRDLQSENLDVLGQIPPEQIPTAAQEFGDRFQEGPNSAFSYLGFPVYLPAFQNKEIRQALSLAINREEITKTIFDGTREPAAAVVSPVVNGSRKDACKYCRFDPEEAKRLYDSAGGVKGTLDIWFNSGAGHDEWVEAVANQWRQNLGITDIKYQTLDFAEYLPKLDEEAITGPFRLGWVMDYPSPQNYLQPIYSTTGSSNNTGYSNKRFDDLLGEGNRASTIEAGIKLYQQAEDLLLEDMPVIPLWWGRNQSVHSERVSGVVVDAYGNVRVESVEVKG